jgi:hypothetical protein
MVPEFDEAGVLPAGIHDATWDELTTRFGTSPHRRQLLVGLKRALDSLRSAGCRRAYVNGSFVTAKDEPGDFDGCWDASGVDLDRLDPMLLDFSNARRPRRRSLAASFSPARLLPTRPAHGSSITCSKTRTRARRRASSPST